MAKRVPPPPCSERDQIIALLRVLWSTKRRMWHICLTDKDWSKQLFPAALFIEEDSRFNFWFQDLLTKLQIPWELIEDE